LREVTRSEAPPTAEGAMLFVGSYGIDSTEVT
jgi:hypothetical protein